MLLDVSRNCGFLSVKSGYLVVMYTGIIGLGIFIPFLWSESVAELFVLHVKKYCVIGSCNVLSCLTVFPLVNLQALMICHRNPRVQSTKLESDR